MAIDRKAKPPKTRRRYSIGEWYGSPFETVSPAERLRNAQAEVESKTNRGLICPFKKDRPCHKKGGVCSLRLYEQIGDGPVNLTGPIITTCPTRFIEEDVIYRWIGKELLGTDNPINRRQIGFLNRFQSPVSEAPDEEEEDKPYFIGRIDNVLIHPTKRPIDWCAVELQAVYFSGKAMGNEFEMMSKAKVTEFQFPAENRRPDWRSSGPKRLLPQLQTKVPDISNWAKKVAVVVDESFYEAFFGPDVPFEPEKHLSNAQIVWFVVKYEKDGNRWHLKPHKVVLSKLASAVDVLTGGIPLSREQFEEQLLQTLPETFRNPQTGS